MVGLIGWFVPDVLGVGYAHVGEALNGKMVLSVMGLLLALKVVATAGCYASGNAGGIFGPSLFIGAMLGGVVIFALLIARRVTLKSYVPFGPFLIVGAVWAALLPATT